MALRITKRIRSLIYYWLNLFNVCLSNDADEPIEIYKNQQKIAYVLFFQPFTTDFDHELEKSKAKFRDGTCSLYSFLDDKSIKNIPHFFNNAVANLVYLMLVTDGKLNKKRKVNQNLMFYYSLAEQAMKNNDHNTAVLLRAALDNTAIRRLKTKETKK